MTAKQFGDGDGDVNPPSLSLRWDYGHEKRTLDGRIPGNGSAPAVGALATRHPRDSGPGVSSLFVVPKPIALASLRISFDLVTAQ